MRVFGGHARSAPARMAGPTQRGPGRDGDADGEPLGFFYALTPGQLPAPGVVFTGGASTLATVEPWLPPALLPVAALVARALSDRWARTSALAVGLDELRLPVFLPDCVRTCYRLPRAGAAHIAPVRRVNGGSRTAPSTSSVSRGP